MRRFFLYLSSIVFPCFFSSAVNKNKVLGLCVDYIFKIGYLRKNSIYYIVVIKKRWQMIHQGMFWWLCCREVSHNRPLCWEDMQEESLVKYKRKSYKYQGEDHSRMKEKPKLWGTGGLPKSLNSSFPAPLFLSGPSIFQLWPVLNVCILFVCAILTPSPFNLPIHLRNL